MSYIVCESKGLFAHPAKVFVYNGTLEELLAGYELEGLSSVDSVHVSEMGVPVATIWYSDWAGKILMDRHNSMDTIVPVDEEDEKTEEYEWEEYDLLGEEESRGLNYPAYLPAPGDDYWKDYILVVPFNQINLLAWEDAPSFE